MIVAALLLSTATMADQSLAASSPTKSQPPRKARIPMSPSVLVPSVATRSSPPESSTASFVAAPQPASTEDWWFSSDTSPQPNSHIE